MASSSRDTTSSSSSHRPFSYDVFINFRGPDTRTDFVALLYNALTREKIHTFLDNKEPWEGEKIRPTLLKAIRGSSISITVFSENYAKSKYCLLELAEIWECHKSQGQKILPVFVRVDPGDVRNQTGSFKEPFEEYWKKCESSWKRESAEVESWKYEFADVESWKNALLEVGNLKGWALKPDATIEEQLNRIEEIVQRVLREVNITPFDECKYLVGIDSHIDKLLSLLNIGSNGVRFVAICGMGGLGKTTIVRAVCKSIFRSFKGSSFLTDVRKEASQGDKGLVSLQNHLLKDILKRDDHNVSNVSQGSKLIERLLHDKKVLIILDDVDDHEQLNALVGGVNWFGRGSRVIITTRDDQSLNAHKVDYDIQIYKPEVLNHENSLQLLSLCAFSKNEPPAKYKQLSHEIVNHAEGLPLTLVVLGSLLYGKDTEEWEDTVEGLKYILDNKVSGMSISNYDDKIFARLKISYDKLSDHAKTIFLDVACHFAGEEIKDPILIWEACDLHSRPALKELTQKHFLKIENDNSGGQKFRMNDQLRYMGMRIVSKESKGHPDKRTRLWSHDEILKVLKKDTGTLKVEGILLPFEVPIDDLSFEDFAKMPKLRFLEVARFYMNNPNGDFSHLPSQLRWLRWWHCPLKNLPINFYHKELVHLDLSMSEIKLAWNDKPQDKVKRFQKLKVLILKSCNALSDSPNFCPWFPCLQRLDLTDCSLLKLSDSICQMASLKSLILHKCSSINKLPTSIGNLKHLLELVLSQTEIEELPDGVGQLEKLEKLDVSCCRKLARLPGSMGRMRSMLYFDLSDTMIVKLPDDFSQLLSLKVLRMGMMELVDQPLPISISCFPQLEELYLAGYKNLESLSVLPSTLTRLELKKCILLPIISYVSQLVSLKELLFYDCESLVGLPDLSKLKRLRLLDINGCENLEEIHSLEGIESLEELRLQDCRNLMKLPDLSKLERLSVLNIRGCENLKYIQIRGIWISLTENDEEVEEERRC